MRRSLAALAVAALSLLGATGVAASAPSHEGGRAAAFTEATTVARVAVAAVPTPQPAALHLASVAVLAAAAAIGAALLGYFARQRRRAVLVPVLASVVRLRGPPARRGHHLPAP